MAAPDEFEDMLKELGGETPSPVVEAEQHTAILPGGPAHKSALGSNAGKRATAPLVKASVPLKPAPVPRLTPPAVPRATPAPASRMTPPPAPKISTEPTAILPRERVFPIVEKPATLGGRKKRDSRPPLDFSKNTTIGRFELIREIARGGMGQVFLARDTKLGRKVAIKFLLRDDPAFVQRFVIEARATARCTHENIITIYEVDEHDGLPYMVLEYLEGKTLSDVLTGNPSVRQFTEIMVSVVRALERAHEHGIVHRDLKPNNVFVTDRGQVKVLDFGVARLKDRADTHAEPAVPVDLHGIDQNASANFTSNSLVGTLPFMSPEQWGTDIVDHQADIWAAGIMFWRALTGVHPIGSTAAERLRTALTDLDTPLPSLATRDPSIPKELVAIVDHCLEKRKENRWQSATELLQALERFLVPKADRAPGEECPYRGLAAFGEEDAKYFFGRSSEIRTALSQLETWPLLAVIGPSGVGKSSFVHAGLIPAMRSAGRNARVCVIRPGRVPLLRLGAVVSDMIGTGEPSPDVIKQLRESPGMFGTMLRQAAARRHQNIVVVVDQLEELFTLCDSDSIREVFLAALLAAADDPSSPVRVVLSMRADFLDRLAGHKQFLAELSRGLFFLTAPDQDNLREALVRPAELSGFAFEDPAIVEDMMHAATSRGALPLLSFAASRLWDARDRERKLFTRAAYDQMGGVGGAFAGHADHVAATIPQKRQKLLRAIMTRLVTPEGTRAVVDHRELLSLAKDPGEVEVILDQLVRGRLIHLETDREQAATVEIVHETLITEWPMMQRWLEDNQAIRGFLHELRQAARQWSARGKPNDLVWRGATAQEALAHARKHVLDLAALEQEFLAAVGRQVRRTRRRRVAVVVALLAAVTLVLAGGAVAFVRITVAEEEAREAADEAVGKRKEAEAARGQLQSKLDIIQAEKAAREAAEQQRLVEEDKRRAEEEKRVRAEEDLARSKEMSREQLQAANQELLQKVREAQAAREKAVSAEAAARKASDEAKQAKHQTELLLAKERAAREKLEKEKRNIYDGDLTQPGAK